MIYLIGGPPRCGKSTAARLLAQRTGASWLLLDNLERVVSHYMSHAECNRARGFGETAQEQGLESALNLAPEQWAAAMPDFAEKGSNERYAAHSTAEIITILRTRARAVWPAVHVLIHCALEQGQDLILDGYQIEPSFLNEFTPEGEPPDPARLNLTPYQAEMVRRGTGYALAHAGDPRIRAVFLCRHDAADTRAGFARATDPNDWILGQENWPVTLERIAAMIVSYSDLIRQQAEACGATAISMDYDFTGQVEKAIHHLTASAGL